MDARRSVGGGRLGAAAGNAGQLLPRSRGWTVERASSLPAEPGPQQRPGIATPGSSVRRLRHNEQLPPAFYGKTSEDVVEWLEIYEEHAVFNGWDDYERLTSLPMFLKDSAKSWYSNLRHAKPTTWVAMQQHLLQTFQLGDDFFLSSRQRLEERTHLVGESLRNYFHEKIRLCHRVDANMSEEMKLKYLFKGIEPSLFSVLYPVVTALGNTTNVFFQQACRLDSNMLDNWSHHLKRPVGTDARTESGTTLMTAQIETQVKKPRVAGDTDFVTKEELAVFAKSLQDSITNALHQRDKPKDNRQERGKWQRTLDGRPICMRCKRPGHLARFCTTFNRATTSQGRVVCFRCGQEGHISRNCREQENEARR